MLAIGPHTRIYLFTGNTDMRKSFDGLRAVVERSARTPLPQSGHLFGFANRRRKLVRFLYWDGTGFWVCGKRLSHGTFWWPTSVTTGHTLEVSAQKLAALIGGLEPPVRERRGWLRVQPVVA